MRSPTVRLVLWQLLCLLAVCTAQWSKNLHLVGQNLTVLLPADTEEPFLYYHEDQEGANMWTGFYADVLSTVVGGYTGATLEYAVQNQNSLVNATTDNRTLATIAPNIVNPGAGNQSIMAHAIADDAVLSVPFHSGSIRALVQFKDTSGKWDNIFLPFEYDLWVLV